MTNEAAIMKHTSIISCHNFSPSDKGDISTSDISTTKMKSITIYQIIAFTILSLPVGSVANATVRKLFDGSCEIDLDCLNVGECCSQYGYCGVGEEYCGIEVQVSGSGQSFTEGAINILFAISISINHIHLRVVDGKTTVFQLRIPLQVLFGRVIVG